MRRFRKIGVGILIALTALAGLAWAFREEILLTFIGFVADRRQPVGPNRPMTWDSGPGPLGRAPAERPPNIVLILADDLGWNDVGYHGSEIATPRLDALAAEGVVLDRFYAQPSCSPTRAALMTGKTPMRLGVLSPISKNNPTGLPLTERLLPEYFRDEGYQTFMTGKWHLGHRHLDYLPTSRGFDHFYGHVTGGIGYWDHVHGGGLDWQRDGKTLREEGYSTHLIADEAVRLIRSRDPARPMLLYASFNAPHLPNEAPPEAVSR